MEEEEHSTFEINSSSLGIFEQNFKLLSLGIGGSKIVGADKKCREAQKIQIGSYQYLGTTSYSDDCSGIAKISQGDF